jgi:hypothetical protein
MTEDVDDERWARELRHVIEQMLAHCADNRLCVEGILEFTRRLPGRPRGGFLQKVHRDTLNLLSEDSRFGFTPNEHMMLELDADLLRRSEIPDSARLACRTRLLNQNLTYNVAADVQCCLDEMGAMGKPSD